MSNPTARVVIAPTLDMAVRHLNYRMPGVTRSNAVWRDLEGNSIKPITRAEQLRGLYVESAVLLHPNKFDFEVYLDIGEALDRFPELHVEIIND